MRDKVKEIKRRYDNAVAGVSDPEMFRDLRVLLAHIQNLEDQLARRIACDAVRAIAEAWEEADHRLLQ